MPADKTASTDILSLGGGHNGLVCAAYLAAAGLTVRVLERRTIVGGAAVTEEFHPGFRNSVASYTVSLLNPKVIRDLRLHAHGLRVVERPFANFLPLPDGRSFRLGGGHTEAEIAKSAPRDVARWADYNAMLDRVVAVLKELVHLTPPNIGERIACAFDEVLAWARKDIRTALPIAHAVKTVDQNPGLALADDALAAQHAGMRLRSADILGVKRPVVGLRIRILGHGFLGAFGKAAAPALVGLHGLSVFCKK